MSEEKKLTDEEKIGLDIVSLLVEFDEMGFAPTTTCPYPEEYAQRWKKALINKIHRLQSENKTLKSELRKECEEHEEFTVKAKAEIERLTELVKSVSDLYLARTTVLEDFREKNAELQKQVDEQKERIRDLITDCDNCPLPRQAVKDTAKEILTELYETKFKMFSDDLIYADNIKVFAKKYGVEVE